MHVKRRSLSNFESGSVALFASLALGGAVFHARAQTATPPAPSATSSTSTPRTVPIPPNQWTAEQLAQAFRRTDSDGDGRISRQEAAVLPGLAKRFDEIDKNKDGSISSPEFDESLK